MEKLKQILQPDVKNKTYLGVAKFGTFLEYARSQYTMAEIKAFLGIKEVSTYSYIQRHEKLLKNAKYSGLVHQLRIEVTKALMTDENPTGEFNRNN